MIVGGILVSSHSGVCCLGDAADDGKRRNQHRHPSLPPTLPPSIALSIFRSIRADCSVLQPVLLRLREEMLYSEMMMMSSRATSVRSGRRAYGVERRVCLEPVTRN